jgi:hypothetical protein
VVVVGVVVVVVGVVVVVVGVVVVVVGVVVVVVGVVVVVVGVVAVVAVVGATTVHEMCALAVEFLLETRTVKVCVPTATLVSCAGEVQLA